MAPWLFGHGFAIAGSGYSSSGWAVHDALQDQMALLDFFQQHVGKPKRVIAWGHSMGGLITAGLIQLHPDRFVAAIPLCGLLAGSVAYANTVLDGAYAFRALMASPSDLEVAGISAPSANLRRAQDAYQSALATQAGQARIAMAAALADLPGWFEPMRPEPDPTDLDAWTTAMDSWFSKWFVPLAFSLRYDLEARGNPSWNTGVDYHHQFEISADRDKVIALYQRAGLDIESDLRALDAGERIAADVHAVAYLEQNISFDGQLRVPVLTMHTTADGTAIAQNETAYADVVKAAGSQGMLRQVFVHRAGHCAFTPAETIAAIQTVLNRLDKGRWDDAALRPTVMSSRATAVGASYQHYEAQFAGPPSSVDFSPGPYPRPFARGSTPPS